MNTLQELLKEFLREQALLGVRTEPVSPTEKNLESKFNDFLRSRKRTASGKWPSNEEAVEP